MTSVASLSLDDITRCCARETEKFSRRQSSDPQFCFELMRRALAEDRSEAFTSVYQIYERQVLNWVYSHSRFVHTGESADYFVSMAWSTFYFALRGPKFADFPSLPQVLSYLKLCVHTGIAQYLRDQQPGATTVLDDQSNIAHTPDLGTQIDVAELLKQVFRLLPNRRDRLLANCVFIQDLKPRQIVKAFPAQWRSEREVSVDLYRIRRVLRNDPDLRRLVGLNLDDPPDERSV